jgi:hypothetical protein
MAEIQSTVKEDKKEETPDVGEMRKGDYMIHVYIE